MIIERTPQEKRQNQAESGTLNPRQVRAVVALLVTKSLKDAAEQAYVGERTLRGWLSEPAFVREVRAAEGQALDAATRRLIGLQDTAIDALSAVLESDTAPPAVKVRAASVVLDSLLRLRELRNLEDRIARLEVLYERD